MLQARYGTTGLGGGQDAQCELQGSYQVTSSGQWVHDGS